MTSRRRPVADVSAADWVVAGVGPFGSGVGGLLPHGFERYARILHPAESPDGQPVRWATVAEWSGRVVHPRVPAAARLGDPSPVAPAFPPEVVNGPRVHLPERDYLLFEGPLAAAADLGWRPAVDALFPQSPTCSGRTITPPGSSHTHRSMMKR